jgi:acyl phosphate:glycerol-3-phosphate acyltransferase
MNAGYYLVRGLTGDDPRRLGTGSTGARNVRRLVGARPAAATFAFDCVKGAGAVRLAQVAGASTRVQALALVAAVAGHVFPVQLGFHGGRGLSTGLGGLLLLDWRLAAGALAVAAVVLAAARAPSVAALLGVAAAPVTGVLVGAGRAAVGAAAACALIVYAAYRRRPAAA